jgi:membrane-bound lytic murein transglycosylase A
LDFDLLPGWSPAKAERAWPAFQASCRAIIESRAPLRPAVQPWPALAGICRDVLERDASRSEAFFRERFQPARVIPVGAAQGFFTGYYEPVIVGDLTPSAQFGHPVLGRPKDLIDMRGQTAPGWDPALEGARRNKVGLLEPYPDRKAIESGALEDATRPVLWLEDAVEVFFAQVQGSARVVLPNGKQVRLVYDGRNGRPYTSIGRVLVERGDIPQDEMSLARCKLWLRANGLRPGEPGRNILQRNQSYVFFKVEQATNPEAGPIGGQGIDLRAGVSMAVDRIVWPYGTPVYVSGDFEGSGLGRDGFHQLMVAQDTGSAIVGPARGDLFIGSGPQAGDVAGRIRHNADFFVLRPRRL